MTWGLCIVFLAMRKGFASLQKARYINSMQKTVAVITILAGLLFCPSGFGQTPPDETEAKVEAENEDGEYFSEVFGLSRSQSDIMMRYVPEGSSEEFASISSVRISELPKTRAEWQVIAEKIRSNQINDKVYYAMLRGEKPADIFTDELMAMYQTNYESWLLKKWDPGFEFEKEEPKVERAGPFAVFTTDGAWIYETTPDETNIECDRGFEKKLKFEKMDESQVLPTNEQLDLMYRTMLNEIACEREASEQ